jgi:hypothetical protein
MRMRRSAAAGVLATGVLVLFAGPASGSIDLDCGDFPDQATAQAVLEANPDDPNGLDADDDGQACEEFTYDGSGQVATPPAGGVATGDGSTASPDSPALPFLVGGLGLAAAGGAAVAARCSARGSA